MRAPIGVALVLSLALAVTAPGVAESWLPAPAVRALALDTLESAEPGGEVTLEATLSPSPEDPGFATLVLLVDGADAVADSSRIRVSVVLDDLSDEPPVASLVGRGLALANQCWRLESELELPDDYRETAVVVETPAGWGSAIVSESMGPPPASPECVTERIDLRRPPEPDGPDDRTLFLLPPEGPVQGSHRFRVLTTSEAVRRVDFFLDDEPVGTDSSPPFTLRIDVGDGRTRRIRAEGFTRDGLSLGSSEVVVNEEQLPFAVRLTAVDDDGEGWVDLAAVVTAPVGDRIERVEFSLGDASAATSREAPYRARLRLPDELDGTEVVRVVATLADGRWVEDARLLAEGAAGATIDVNLVELYAVVCDDEGLPITTLTADDFEIDGPGRTRFPVDRFELAQDLPLSLGLVIDTSESMWTLMPDTKQAAASFLLETVDRRDQAFLVDFDNEPRLVQESTSDVRLLLRRLGSLEAGGATAMFDAVVFSALHFDAETGRRALVLLTDGDDYRSRFDGHHAVEQARLAGVPVYVIALSGFDDVRRDLKTIEVEALAEGTGGRVFYVGSHDEVKEAYRRIGLELRSQYLLGFSTSEPLAPKDLVRLRVSVGTPGLTVRRAIRRP